MANNRIYYGVYNVGIAKNGTSTFTAVRGLQSIGTNLNFELEFYFEVGQTDTYAALEGRPGVSVTMEKCLDGQAPIYCLATNGSTSPSLAGRSSAKCIVGMSIYTDTNDAASGTPLTQAYISGLFVNSLNYNFPINGPFSEQVELAGNDITWLQSFTAPTFAGTDSPLAGSASGYVNRRMDLLQGSAATLWPQDIPGISASGTNDIQADGFYKAKIQSVKIACNMNRQELFEQGSRIPYFRYIQFPVDVKTDIEVNSQTGNAKEAVGTSASNLTQRTLFFKVREGTQISLGSKNLLQTITTNGGQAQQGGNVVTETYTYQNKSFLTVSHPQDPSGL